MAAARVKFEEPALARAIADVAGLALMAGRRHDHDDASAALLLDHEPGHVLGAQECPGEVHGDLTVPALERHLEHAQAAEDPGVCDEDVDAVKALTGAARPSPPPAPRR